MCKTLSHNALDRVVFFRKGLEKGNNTLRDTCLFAFFVDVRLVWVEEKDLGIGQFFLIWLLYFWFQSGVDRKDRPDLQLGKYLLHFIFLICFLNYYEDI